MEQFDRELRHMAGEEPFEVPDCVHQKMADTLAALPEKKAKTIPLRRRSHLAAMAACAALLLLVVLPNVSTVYASAVDGIPVLGDLVRVVTIRNYSYNSDTHQLELRVPSVDDEEQSSVFINQDVDQIAEEIKKQFYAELEKNGEKGRESVAMDYDVLCNTPRWFTMRLEINTIRASCDTTFRYYNVDRSAGKIIQLEDLFISDGYSDVIAKDIQRQMREQMDADENIIYWLDKEDFGADFTAVKGDHNYYFNEAGDLVIPFDKYEVGPGSIGSPEFVIDYNALSALFRPEYQNMSRMAMNDFQTPALRGSVGK